MRVKVFWDIRRQAFRIYAVGIDRVARVVHLSDVDLADDYFEGTLLWHGERGYRADTLKKVEPKITHADIVILQDGHGYYNGGTEF